MSRKSKRIKSELIQILQSPDIHIRYTDLSQYATKPDACYFVDHGITCKFEMNIEPKRFGISAYTIIMENGDKFSCLARPNAVFFHRPVADDILEVYRTLKLRYLIQNSQKRK